MRVFNMEQALARVQEEGKGRPFILLQTTPHGGKAMCKQRGQVMLDIINSFVGKSGLSGQAADLISIALAALCVVLLASIAYFVMRKLVVGAIAKLIAKSQTTLDDIFKERKVFSRLSHLAPGLVIYLLGPAVFVSIPLLSRAIATGSLVYIVLMVMLFLDALLGAAHAIYRTFPISRTFPITSFVQIGKLVIYFFGVITALSVILGESPLTFLAGLGALTAVLMFVFKDPILGFVAGIQLSANKMVAVGDWIEMPQYGVDGDVMEIALTTVKIRNFDKTVTTIPTQSLINDSFKNWRGMQETGGRRIKRALYIDVNSIGFCDEARLKRFSKIQFIADYIAKKDAELIAYNKEKGVDPSSAANGRRLTNIGTFRAYIEAYLHAHPKISDRLTFLVRQLKPTEHGVPIEIYVFTTTTKWVEYEGIQADIFDHLLAVAGEFDLRLFQNPSGADFSRLITQQS